MRRGASLLEVLICLAIIGVMASMMLPAVQKVRATAASTSCQNNLRQIGIGIQHYHEVKKVLPHPRLCPTPWMGGSDPLCKTIITPGQYTGPAEQWWCPYDNRPGATPTAVAAGYQPGGLIFPYVGNEIRVFRCPDAFDRTPTSPTAGQRFQVSYALTPEMGGRNLAEYVGATASEHDDVPYCKADGSNHAVVGWPATPDELSNRHRPQRHNGAFAIARSDGSVHVHR
jgi:prepilin-type N-terminal cleavage/methylation domain-containing protein